MSETPDNAPVTAERSGEAVVARVRIKMMDDAALRTLTRAIDDAAGGADGNVRLVVLDLSRVSILPSMALGLLVQVANKCKARDQRLTLAAVPPQLRQVFAITRLDRVFQFADSVEAALA